MQVNIFKQDYATDLSYRIEENMNKYVNANFDWSLNAPMESELLTLPDDVCE